MRTFTLLALFITFLGLKPCIGSEGQLQMTNNVFFFITEGGPLASLGTTVQLNGTDTSFTFVTSEPFGGEMIADVPFGTYIYTISKPCFETISDSVVVDDNGGMGISVFADLQALSQNNVFFFITEGGPLASLGTAVEMFNADTSYSFVTSDPFGGEMLADVPYGEYTVEISKECFTPFSTQVMIDCNEGQGISIFADIAASTSNNVFFFITEGGPLASIGTTVELSNADTSYSFVTSDPFGGEVIESVPFGEYIVRIEKACFQSYSDTLTVDCNNGMNISVFANLEDDSDAVNSVFFFITEGGPLASLGATVELANDDTTYTFVTSDPFGGEMLADVPVGSYTYSVSKECYLNATGSLDVVCDPNMGISVFIDLEEGAPNDIFFFITEGGPLASLGTTVTLTSPDTTISFVTSDPFGGEMLSQIPGGTYSYSIIKPCFDEISGSVLIGCNNGMAISLFADLVPSTANDVFFFITEGSPLASLGTSVTLSNSDTSFSFVTSDPFGGEVITAVPYGEYGYTIENQCYFSVSDSLTVDCNNGMGVSVFADLQPDTTTANNVFFFITEGGPLASLGAQVVLTGADTSYSFTTSDPFGGEMVADVPVGTYTYSITKECFLEATGSVEVVCDPNMGVSVFADLQEGAPNDVFFFITEGGPLASLGATVSLSNADTSIVFTTSDPFGGEMLAEVPGGSYDLLITKPCFDDFTSTVLVGCNGGMGISVFADLTGSTTNDVFFFITEGGPLASLGTRVEFVSADTTVTFITSDPFGGEMVSALPYGEYNLIISKECFETDSSTVVLDCNNGDPISVFADLQEIIASDSIAASICAGDTYVFGDQELTEAGEYQEVFMSAQGCDSIVTLSLNVDTIDVSVTQSDNVLTANAENAEYQWVDCNNGFTSIEGANNQEFVAELSGSYAVVVSQNGCVDTSACVDITISGVASLLWPDEVRVYPNPVQDVLQVEFGESINTFDLRVTNSMGAVIFERHVMGMSRLEIPTASFVPGAYVLHMRSGTIAEAIQFVKVR